MSFNLDLSNVPESNNFSLIPNGAYTVIVDDAEVKETKSGTGSYINAKFKLLGGQFDGRFIWHMFNIRNDNPKAVEIGLGQLKTFMKCAGVKEMKLSNVLDLVGLRCEATIKTRSDDYGDKNVISYFKPSAAKQEPTQAPHSSGNPF